MLDENRLERDQLRDELAGAERKASSLLRERDECHCLMEASERQRKQVHADFADLEDRFNEALASKENLLATKQKLDGTQNVLIKLKISLFSFG